MVVVSIEHDCAQTKIEIYGDIPILRVQEETGSGVLGET